jgi:hypothetical protein
MDEKHLVFRIETKRFGRKFYTKLLASILILSLAATVLQVEAQIPRRDPDWSTPDEVTDLAVSADGSLIAAATLEGIKVYDATGSLLWSWSQDNCDLRAVRVSDDGNVVVAALENTTSKTSHLLYWKNAKTLRGHPQPIWGSENLGNLWIRHKLLDVSSDGNQVVVIADRRKVFYWNNALTLSGFNKPATWTDDPLDSLENVDISDDGDITIIIGVFTTYDNEIYHDHYSVVVYKGCKSRTGIQGKNYDLRFDFDGIDYYSGRIALSDNGKYLVASLGMADRYCIYFFNTSMVGDWAPQWSYELNGNEQVEALDISSDGNTIVAVTNELDGLSPCDLLIFQAAASKMGDVSSADYEFTLASHYTHRDYDDVSVDGAGRLAAAGTGDYLFAVNATTGEPLWLYNGTYTRVSMFVRVSEDGRVVASAGYEVDSLYYFTVYAPMPVGGYIIPADTLMPASITSGTTVPLLILGLTAAAALTVAIKKKINP